MKGAACAEIAGFRARRRSRRGNGAMRYRGSARAAAGKSIRD
jgi:hypothetical protein